MQDRWNRLLVQAIEASQASSTLDRFDFLNKPGDVLNIVYECQVQYAWFLETELRFH